MYWNRIYVQLGVSAVLILIIVGGIVSGSAETPVFASPPAVASSPELSPAIVSKPPLTATIGLVYSYTVHATGNPTPTYSLDEAPIGMVIDINSGTISWTPERVETYAIAIRANNVYGDTTQSYELIVASQESNLTRHLFLPMIAH